MNVEARRKLEKQVAKAFIKEVLAAGFAVTVHDGEDEALVKSRSESAIIDAMFSVDEEHLYIYQPEDIEAGTWKRFGWAFFVYGNDGWDAINDYTTNLEPYMKGVDAIVKQYYG